MPPSAGSAPGRRKALVGRTGRDPHGVPVLRPIHAIGVAALPHSDELWAALLAARAVVLPALEGRDGLAQRTGSGLPMRNWSSSTPTRYRQNPRFCYPVSDIGVGPAGHETPSFSGAGRGAFGYLPARSGPSTVAEPWPTGTRRQHLALLLLSQLRKYLSLPEAMPAGRMTLRISAAPGWSIPS